MQADRLEILGERPIMLTRAAHEAKEKIENNERDTDRLPATKKFTEHDLGAGYGFREQRKEGPRFAFRRNLAGRSRDGNHERRDPNQQQADFLQIPDDVRLVKEVYGSKKNRDQSGKNE